MRCLHPLSLLGAAFLTAPLAAQSSVPRNSAAEWFVHVYRPDGSIQCQQGRVVSLEEGARGLASREVRIVGQEKRMLPMAVATQCGLSTGMTNAYLVAVSDPSKLPLDRGFLLWPEEERGAVVSIGDGVTGCTGAGRSLNASSWLLKAAGVNLIAMGMLSDPSPTKGCAPRVQHLFWIAASGVPAAQKAGFIERASRLPSACASIPAASATVPQQAPTVRTVVAPEKATKAFGTGTQVKVTFFVAPFGTVDSVATDPAPTHAGAGRDFVKEMREVTFVPAVRAGCVVPSQASLTITAS